MEDTKRTVESDKKKQKSFVAYYDWIETFEALSNEEAGKLAKIIFRFVNGLDTNTDDKVIKMSFIPIKQTLERDIKKWEKYIIKQQINGKKGGRPKNPTEPKKPNGFLENPTKPKKADNVNVNANVNNINNIYNEFVADVEKGDFKERLKSTYSRLKLKENSLTPLLKDFQNHLIEKNEIHDNTNNYYEHFVNWLNKQEQIGKLTNYKK